MVQITDMNVEIKLHIHTTPYWKKKIIRPQNNNKYEWLA